MASLNWSELVNQAGSNNSSMEPIPDGDYELKVLEAEHRRSQSGKNMFKITTEVQGGPYASRRIWDNLVIDPGNETGLNMFFMKMGILGLNKQFFDQNPTDAQIEQALAGRAFRATVSTRTYNGQEYNDIKKYHKSSAAATPNPAQATEAAPAPSTGDVPPPPPAPSSPVNSGEETPF